MPNKTNTAGTNSRIFRRAAVRSNSRFSQLRAPLTASGIASFFASLIILALLLSSCGKEQAPGARLVAQQPAAEITGFARADKPRLFQFPEDHGPHPDFQTEWWYYTGNLQTEVGRRFGYQLTFFRRALLPPQMRIERSSDWAASQVYMAHFALTDVQGGEHWAFEKFSRGAADLASAQSSPYAVWLDNWQVRERTQDGSSCAFPASAPCVFELLAFQAEIDLKLELIDLKGPVLQGDQGLSRKGAGDGQASYYYSLTRLQTSGSIRLGDNSYEVSGWSWMDHEFSTSALSREQVGWDWFSIQLDDGSDLMVFQLRRSDGSIDLLSSGTWIEKDGKVHPLASGDFEIQVVDHWTSPNSAAVYPSRWVVRIPSQGVELSLTPFLPDQESNLSYAYWEGAVKIEGVHNRQSVNGSGFVELTGYSGSMGGEF